MWYTLSLSSMAQEEYYSAATDLLRSTFRQIILAVGTICIIGQFVTMLFLPESISRMVDFSAVIILFVCLFTYWLVSKQVLIAQVFWQIGLAVAVMFAMSASQQPVIGFFYILFPLMAVVTIGWPAALLSEGMVIALLWWFPQNPAIPPLPLASSLGIVIGGIFTGLLGWIATNSLLTVTQWSLFYYEKARREMEDAYDQRLELKQTQEDLIKVNQELTRLSDRLKVMQQVAEEARQAREEFVTNVSHELRTPLNMIIGFSEMIVQSPEIYGDDLPVPLLADIDAIMRNSQHLSKLVNDVLDLSQIEAGRMALNKEWVSLHETVDEVVFAMGVFFKSKGLYLETEVPQDLSPVFCDNTRIRQVLLNLVSNAGRFIERGGVTIKAWQEQNNIVVSVTDTGTGISPENQEKIFEPFRQVDSSIRRRYEGSGMGLNISKQFVEMHHGKIWLKSTAGVGTTFYFSLPLEVSLDGVLADTDAGHDVTRWNNPYGEYEYKLRTRKSKVAASKVLPRFVLLEQGDTLQRLFSRYWDGVELVPVRDGEEAVHELNRLPAQALIVNIPPFEEIPIAPNQLTHLPFDTPVVTCWVTGDDEAAKQLGVVRYLVKPITREILLSTLEELGEDVKSVLVVDDEPELLQLFARMLSKAPRKYRIWQASDGQRALDLLYQRKPDVILLDLIMPGVNGFEVLQRKAQDPSLRHIPVVVVSSRDPLDEPIVSNALTIMRGKGLSVSSLVKSISTVTEIISLPSRFVGQAQIKMPAD